VRISKPVLDQIRRALTAAYPVEGCGFLLGQADDGGHPLVRRHLPVPNRRAGDPEAQRRYLMEPADYRAAERSAVEAGLSVVGTYHSHPNAPARPSAFDLEHAWPWYTYLIVAVGREGPTEARVWRLRDDRSGFTEQPLEVHRIGEEW
jgi:proteasome lid subunit RPN8/RPN11